MEIRDLTTFLDYLDSVHKRTRRVVVCIPAAELEWSPATGKWSFGSGHGRHLADGLDAVIEYYDRLHVESRAIFAALTPQQIVGKATTPAGTPITTWKWLRAMLEHEAHHRGQLYLMLSLRGVKTPPIYGLTEEEVAARAVSS